MKSILDHNITLSERKSAVTLCRAGLHAAILVEEMVDGIYDLRKYDFIKAGTREEQYYTTSLFDNRVSPGYVRVGAIMLREKTKKALYESKLARGLTQGSNVTWPVKEDVLRVMIDSIYNDREKNKTADAVPFHIKGWEKSDGQGHSCISWAESKLALANIELTLSAYAECVDSLVARECTPAHIASHSGTCLVL